MMLPPAEFAEAMSRHGIGQGTRVVLYSRDRLMWATRVWWMLHVMGFDDAAVLDGGFEKWQAEGRPVSTAPASYPPARFVPRPRPALMVDKDAVLAALDDPAVRLVNTLSPADFAGAGPSRYGRPGRIPGSVNLPWPDLTLPESNVLIPLDEAARRLAALDVAGPSASSATAAAASRRPWGCSCSTAWATTTSRSTTPRWPSGRATRACRSSTTERLDRREPRARSYFHLTCGGHRWPRLACRARGR